MIMLIYGAIAIAFLILVIGFVRKSLNQEPEEAQTEASYAPRVGNGRWLALSERIFDPCDARWLAEELAFPKLAKALTLDRRRLAIHWLEALQGSFDQLIRTPVFAANGGLDPSGVTSWRMLWLTLRFKLLVSYALFVVKVFGPYHRLIPSFSWVPFSRPSPHHLSPTFVSNRSTR